MPSGRRSGRLSLGSNVGHPTPGSFHGCPPLHIALGHLLVNAFPLQASRTDLPIYSTTFTAEILGIVAREAFEIGPRSATYAELLAETDAVVKKECSALARRNEKIQNRGQRVPQQLIAAAEFHNWLGDLEFNDVATGSSFIDALERDLRERLSYDYQESPLDVPEPFERRSPIGLWVRSLALNIRKLGFEETGQVARAVMVWCGEPTGSSSSRFGAIDRRTAMEDTIDQRSTIIKEYGRAAASGDWSGAMSGLRRFYDYKMPQSGSQHQHALLNLASFHFTTGGLESARSALDEAIKVARTEGDQSCLKLCMSLSHRLDLEAGLSTSGPSSAPIRGGEPAARLPKSTSAVDELWSLRAAINLGEPIPRAFRRIYSTQSRLLPLPKPDREQPHWSAEHPILYTVFHTAQSSLFSLLGSTTLEKVHQDIASRSLEVEVDDTSRLMILLARVQGLVDRGEFEVALRELLDFAGEGDMDMIMYHRWAEMVWGVLERKVSLSGDDPSGRVLAALRSPPGEAIGPGGPIRDAFDPETPITTISSSNSSSSSRVCQQLRDSLRKAEKMKQCLSPAHLILPHILSTRQKSSELGYWQIYRFSTILFAETLLSMISDDDNEEGLGMAQKALKEVQGIWEDILGGDDKEVVARGALIMGKGYVELGMRDAESSGGGGRIEDHFKKATRFLQLSLETASTLNSRSIMIEALSLLAILSELTGDGQVDQLNAKLEIARNGDKQLSKKTSEEIRKIAEVVKLVGVRVAEGWR